MSTGDEVAMGDRPTVGSRAGTNRYYMLAMLTLAYALAFGDRQIVVILQESIKLDMGLSDAQLGLLSGPAFGIVYSVLGVPLAHWADHSNRRNIVGYAIVIGSLMTAAYGVISSYAQMLVARIGVGVGIAGLSPAAHSMISDRFSEMQRGRALSVYSMGIFIGVAFAFVAGGWANQFWGWRVAFLVVGLPGLALALLARLTVAEPRRGGSEADAGAKVAAAPPFLTGLTTLWKIPAIRYIMLGGGLCGFVNTGYGFWVPSFLMRTHHMTSGEVGSWLALIAGVGGAISVSLSGFLADVLGPRNRRWYMWVPALGALISTPLRLTALLATNLGTTLIFIALAQLLDTFFLAPSLAAGHGLVAPRLRALTSSVLFFAMNMLGMVLGPPAAGLASDLLSPAYGDQALRYGLILISLAGPLAALTFVIGSRHLSPKGV